MTTVEEQIRSADEAICQNIDSLADQRALLSQNVLAQLRNLVEGVAVRLHAGSLRRRIQLRGGRAWTRLRQGQGKFNFLGKFHKLIQKSASHYTLDGDASERLMLKYYEYLHRIRSLLKDSCGIAVLANLESFPVDLDPSLREYHEKIAARIEAVRSTPPDSSARDRYYIHKTRPFFVGGRIYYEVTFYRAVNKVSKFDRIIAFTDIDMTDEYAAMLTLQSDSIEVLGQTMPITIIREWEVSIRPCEFDNFARLLGIDHQRSDQLGGVPLPDARADGGLGQPARPDRHARRQVRGGKAAGTAGVAKPQIFPVLDEAAASCGQPLRVTTSSGISCCGCTTRS